MIKIDTIDVMGFKGAIKSMRNALESWDKSDSFVASCHEPIIRCNDCPFQFIGCNEDSYFFIGKNDMKLAKSLIKAGKSDRKSLRMIHVQADVTAPLYWWKEYDTYKVATTTNSTSTMHTLHKRDLTLDRFSLDGFDDETKASFKNHYLTALNNLRQGYVKTKDKGLWHMLIKMLPCAFNQMRTIDLNYETLFSIYHERKNHKLDEWHQFCDWILTLPYMKDFIGVGEEA